MRAPLARLTAKGFDVAKKYRAQDVVVKVGDTVCKPMEVQGVLFDDAHPPEGHRQAATGIALAKPGSKGGAKR